MADDQFAPYDDSRPPSLQDDLLGFGVYVAALCRLIKGAHKLPFTMGIFGEWGSGKTTLMEFMTQQLDRDSIKWVWFNPWKYDRKEALWRALINEILTTMDKDPSRPKGPTFRKALKGVAELVVKAGAGAARVAIAGVAGSFGEQIFQQATKLVETEQASLQEFANRFEDAFAAAVRMYVGENGRLVIFIDDIDRCIPENAITVFESLKLFMDKSRCIFMIGADQAIVQAGIQKLYGPNYSSRDYLEKIVQVHFHIPEAPVSASRKLWDSEKWDMENPETVWGIATAVTGANLRQIKRFINAFRLAKLLGEERRIVYHETEDILLAELVLLGMKHPDLYELCAREPEVAARFFDSWGQSYDMRGRHVTERAGSRYLPYVEDVGVRKFFEQLRGSNRTILASGGVDGERLAEAFRCIPRIDRS